MALSEEEQRLLAQLEASLAAEDPKLANMMRSAGTRKIHRRRATIAGLGFLLGIGALIGGMQLNPLISIAGFVLMVGATLIGINSWQHVNDAEVGGKQEGPSGDLGNESVKQFMDKMEERWRRRQDEGM